MKDRMILLVWQKIKKVSMLIVCFLICHGSAIFAQQLAFPGAEGYGRYTSGGRSGKVIEVSNLKNSGTGSFRAAIQSYGTRTVVFRVSGIIELTSELAIENNNITIAGQTAPGDGICIKGYPLKISANNVIVRYIRFRLGDENRIQQDALYGNNRKNIIIDHCSMSWAYDETSSFYDNTDFTMQWCMITESLDHSYHEKGDHGYGGIWGGMGATFHHNLLAHHTSRLPRFQGSRNNSTPETEIVDHRNNVIYNWGDNSAYGGESGNQNLIANYYKFGPATQSGVQNRIVNPYDDKGKWYVADNFVYGYPQITEDNWSGGVQGWPEEKIRVYTPHPFGPVFTHTAEVTYLLVLEHAGTVLPKRDSVDARIVEEVKTQTATYGGVWGANSGIIDSQTDVGGWPKLNSGVAPTDDDHDGMADNWESARGLDPSDPEDRNGDINGDGYTNLENYLNSLCIREDFILPPINLMATGFSQNQINLSWQENALAETGFSIERSMRDTSGFAEIGTVGANDTSFSDLTGSPATIYYYRVRSYNQVNTYSIYSNTVKTKTSYADGRPGEASDPVPANNTTNVQNTQVLSWTGGTAATSHDVYLGTTNPPEFQGNQTETFFDPRGLLDSTTYYWRINEVNDAGTSEGILWQFTTEPFMEAKTGHWPLDRGFGPIGLDQSGYQNHAYLTNMIPDNWIEGFSGSALQFDGQDDHLLVYHDETIDVDIRGFTLSFWLKQTNGNISTPWISKGIDSTRLYHAGYEIWNTNKNEVVFRVTDGEMTSEVCASNADFVTGEWVLVTAVRDKTNHQLRLYADGVLKASGDDKSYDLSQRGSLYFGSTGEQENFHSGALDDIRFYNYSLSEQEISDLYNEYTGVTEELYPVSYTLKLNNHPNPFNPKTTIVYSLPNRGRATLNIFNLMGQKIYQLIDEIQSPGEYKVIFDGTDYGSGIYYCTLHFNNRILTRKMLLLK